MPNPQSTLQVRTTAKAVGVLELSLETLPLAQPADDEVVIRVEGAPINPSDLNLLLGRADLTSLSVAGSGSSKVLSAVLPPEAMRVMSARLDKSLPVGNEGAGVVVAAGPSPQAQALLGKTVAFLGGAMYAQHRIAKAGDVLPLPEGITAAQGASALVNPLTALGMVETARTEGHAGLVHTAAASNLGQMLVKLCKADSVPLVNIVRSPAQAAILRGLGAEHVCDSSQATFLEDLTRALTVTGSTLAFDAIGGGRLTSQILTAMEAASLKRGGTVTAYGTSTHKQVYIYGGLDLGPTEIVRSFGMYWGVGGWFVSNFLQKTSPARVQELRARVASELRGIFASHYTREISLTELLDPEIVRAYARKATGEKYLLNPSR